MLHDMRLLLWLRIRHARTTLSRIMHMAGTDPVADGGAGERAYQLYIAVFIAIALVLLWAALLDTIASTFALLGIEAAVSAFHAGLLAMAAVFVATGASGLRRSPLTCSHPDIAYVFASGMNMPSVAFVALAVRVLGSGIVGGLLGYALGVGLASASLAVEPVAMALVGGLGTAAAAGGGWLVGAVRLAGKRARGSVAWAGAVLVVLALAAVALSVTADPLTVLAGSGFALAMFAEAAVTIACVVAATLCARTFDRAIIIEENALFADMQPFGAFSPIDPNTIREYRRRKKIALRRPRFRLPAGSGRAVLTARAALSLVRQYDGLPVLVMQGLVAAPLGVYALSGAGGLIALLFWIQALLMFSQGIREETRAFGDDIRVRLVRDRLPFNALELLVFDTLPSFALVAAISTGAIVLFAPYMQVSVLWAVVLGLVLSASYVLARGFDAIRLPLTGRTIDYEVGALALVSCLGIVASFSGPTWWLVLAASALGALFAAIVRYGTERA
ncbi:hypothetical protein [Raoultibacter phocaeensis]|uniref:hypothetical protein n=1 Tax=Raoultibacter phocaeensis TaxID=2479841 RepID=UPI00111A3DDB|nr:hypothetical protein [Raoultibacter phocaeensis]